MPQATGQQGRETWVSTHGAKGGTTFETSVYWLLGLDIPVVQLSPRVREPGRRVPGVLTSRSWTNCVNITQCLSVKSSKTTRFTDTSASVPFSPY